MNITVLPSGDLAMSAEYDEQFEYSQWLEHGDYKLSPVAMTEVVLSLVDQTRDGVDYDFVDPDKTLHGDAVFVLSDGNNLYHFDSDDLLPRLAAGETVTWKRI